MEFVGLNIHLLKNNAKFFTEKVVSIYFCTGSPCDTFVLKLTNTFYKLSFFLNGKTLLSNNFKIWISLLLNVQILLIFIEYLYFIFLGHFSIDLSFFFKCALTHSRY